VAVEQMMSPGYRDAWGHDRARAIGEGSVLNLQQKGEVMVGGWR